MRDIETIKEVGMMTVSAEAGDGVTGRENQGERGGNEDGPELATKTVRHGGGPF